MTITVTAVYEGGGVLKLEKPIDLKEKSKVHVIIETDPEPEAASAVEDDDATGWKAARQFIGMWKDAPARSSASLSEDHDRVIYRRK
jgi:predicted DNA-binding antitoxin AbrB/MazE fold protein